MFFVIVHTIFSLKKQMMNIRKKKKKKKKKKRNDTKIKRKAFQALWHLKGEPCQFACEYHFILVFSCFGVNHSRIILLHVESLKCTYF